jgi:hypothetical protein
MIVYDFTGTKSIYKPKAPLMITAISIWSCLSDRIELEFDGLELELDLPIPNN